MFKVGDMVRIKCYRDDLWDGWTETMKRNIGKVGKVEDIDVNYYCIDRFWYLEEELEKVLTKDDIIDGAIRLIKRIAKEKSLVIVNKGTGHAFDNTFWKDIAEDDSGIPEIIAKNDNYSIGLRSFWGSPEIDIRQKTKKGEDLLVFNFSDSIKENDEYIHTGYFSVREVRVCADDYKMAIKEIYNMIEEVVNDIHN